MRVVVGKVDGWVKFQVKQEVANGSRGSINERLNVSLNADGTLKYTVAAALDEWIVHLNAGVMARVDNSTITMVGDWRAMYSVNRRVKLVVQGLELVGDVASVGYAAGVTTISLVDLLDSSGFIGLIGDVPTQIAYGPLTGGDRGNTPKRFTAIRFPAGAVTYELKGAGTDLIFTRNGVPTAIVTDGGFSGFAPMSIGKESFTAETLGALVPTGAITAFAGSTAPAGWLMCAGQAVSRSAYANLYVAIGTAYGAGNGSTTFNLPDLRGRVAFGLDNMGGTDAGRLSATNTLGGTGGAQTKTGTTDSYTLTVADIPAHSHDGNVNWGGLYHEYRCPWCVL